MKRRITSLHARAKAVPRSPEPADREYAFRSVIERYTEILVKPSKVWPSEDKVIGTFFRRIVASDKVWYLVAHHSLLSYASHLGYPYYVEFRGDHYRFMIKTEAQRFADNTNGEPVRTTRERFP